ncbi:hypothetical protein BGZ80_008544, partial [Entomortierella chlamydospora]
MDTGYDNDDDSDEKGSSMERRRFRVWLIMQRSLTLFVDGAESTKLMFHCSRDVRAGTPMEAKAKVVSTRPMVYTHNDNIVSSWNIAEKDALLKFAPKYFEYMEKTNEAPIVLAKIFGFYTLKIKNGESGHALKIDALVMEHLFYNQKIIR